MRKQGINQMDRSRGRQGWSTVALRRASCAPGYRALASTISTGLAIAYTTASAAPFPAQVPLSSLLPVNGGDGSTGFYIDGIGPNDEAGRTISAVGDVNGDGIVDLLIGAEQAQAIDAGQSYVVFGRDTAHSGLFASQFPLASL